MSELNTLGDVALTGRGFEVIRFEDIYGAGCSLQASSRIGAVWLGPDNARPRVLASEARDLGVPTSETTGWVPFPVPTNVLMTTRAHLNRDQVAALIHHLQGWLDNDTFAIGSDA